MSWRPRGVAGWLVAIAGLAAACSAGVVLTEDDGSTVLISSGMFKQVSPDEPYAVVADAEAGIITFIHTKKRVYAQGTPEELCSTVQAFLDLAQAGMTAEQRAMVRRLLDPGDGKPPEVTVRKAGDGGKVAGLPTTRWVVEANGAKYEELWLTTDEVIVSELGDPGKVMEMVSRLGACLGAATGGAFSSRPDSTAAYRSLFKEGLALRVRSYQDGEVDESETRLVEKRDIPASEFLPPEGYKKTEFMQLLR